MNWIEAIAAAAALFVVIACAAGVALALVRRARRRERPLPALSERQIATRNALEATVRALSTGPRNDDHPGSIDAAAAWIEKHFEGSTRDEAGNVVFAIDGSPREVVVIGAHYDSAGDSPGADDNASGVAVVLELAKRFRSTQPRRSIRFVAFAREEPPHFQTGAMGSLRYALGCRDRGEKVVAMISVESVGFFSRTQTYPAGLEHLYPSRGDFLGFVANLPSARLLATAVRTFRRASPLPVVAAALPSRVPGVELSDHWSFWQIGAPALMLTDTAPFRNPNYHLPSDLPDTLDYNRMALAVDGLEEVVRKLGRVKSEE